MRVSVCVGDYAKIPYCLPGLEMKIFCMEELCCCMKENAFLLDASLLNDSLLDWIERECGLRELSRALHPLVHKQGSLSAFVVMIQRYVGFYDEKTVGEIEEVIRQGAGLSGIEKRKTQIDYLVKKKKYKSAIKAYDELLKNWDDQETGGKAIPAADCLAKIWHNKGVAYAGLMRYDKAAECFEQAFGLDGNEEYCVDLLTAKRMHLSEEEYVDFAAGYGEWYPCTLKLEKKLEKALGEWESQPDYLRLYNRRESGSDRRRFHEDNERLAQALKEGYRRGM